MKGVCVPASPSGSRPAGGAAKASPAKPSIPNASAMFVQLHYPEAVEALAKAIGPLIAEEFDCEPRGTKWDAMSEKDRIIIRYIALCGLNRLITHCHINAASAGEAGTATTVQQGVVHEHATGEAGDAQGGSHDSTT